jgi:hypothetical protein
MAKVWQYVVFVVLEDDEPPGDQCAPITELLHEDYTVVDIGWIAEPFAIENIKEAE